MTALLLDEIDATGLLSSRPRRVPDWRREAEALGTLAEVFANAPQKLAQTLAETALTLTGAQAAGISIEETDATPQIFRWVATAGTYSCYLNGTMPRDFSPCGEVVRRNAPVLMRHMHKVYEYVSALHEPPHEVLLVPFQHRGMPVGTVWIVSHNDDRGFDGEDLRVVQNLTRFAGAAVESVGQVKQLTELDARKDRFMAMLAHEMRNPLSAISLATQVIKRGGGDPGRRGDMVASLERQVGQLTSLVRDMMDVAAVRSGKLSIDKAVVSLQAIVAGALESCDDQIRGKRQRLLVQLPEETLLVDGDAMRLTQVLVNLINNAVKYTPPGGTIEVEAARRGEWVELWLTDSGVGIDPSEIDSVFDMYMQVAMDKRPVDSGLGIGLALVKQLVGMHQGQVTVSSEGLGRGSTFHLVLPAHRPLASPPDSE